MLRIYENWFRLACQSVFSFNFLMLFWQALHKLLLHFVDAPARAAVFFFAGHWRENNSIHCGSINKNNMNENKNNQTQLSLNRFFVKFKIKGVEWFLTICWTGIYSCIHNHMQKCPHPMYPLFRELMDRPVYRGKYDENMMHSLVNYVGYCWPKTLTETQLCS